MPPIVKLLSRATYPLLRTTKLLSAFCLLLILIAACGPLDHEAASPTPAPTATKPVPLPLPAATAVVLTKSPATTPEATVELTAKPGDSFDGESAYGFLLAQMEFGPRWPGSPGHSAAGEFIAGELNDAGWYVEEQLFEYLGVQGRNIIGRANVGKGPVIILGAHYDTRIIADRTQGSNQPVPGAVDGASGVAVLLELAQVLDLEEIDREIWLAFFDMEDNGGNVIPGFDWAIGAQYMANNLQVIPEAVVVVDMVGDADQQLYFERYSDPALQAKIWGIAADLGYGDYFIPAYKHRIIDDHIRFLSRGIVAIDIIDFDYPYWHTIDDTADKASPDSLMRVGHVLQEWLEGRLDSPE